MIYDRVGANAPIQQGDIFVHIPRVDLSFDKLTGFGFPAPMVADFRIILRVARGDLETLIIVECTPERRLSSSGLKNITGALPASRPLPSGCRT
jgi:hypothetical protein